jgi:hypothetical protein
MPVNLEVGAKTLKAKVVTTIPTRINIARLDQHRPESIAIGKEDTDREDNLRLRRHIIHRNRDQGQYQATVDEERLGRNR